MLATFVSAFAAGSAAFAASAFLALLAALRFCDGDRARAGEAGVIAGHRGDGDLAA